MGQFGFDSSAFAGEERAQMRNILIVGWAALSLGLLLLPESRGLALRAEPAEQGASTESPAAALGRRLFRETRFAQYFAAHAQGPNSPLSKGDPSLAELPTGRVGHISNPYAGKSMSCAGCHFEEEAFQQGGMRAYADFSLRSLVPDRADGKSFTLRNSPAMVGMIVGEELLHYDGEFANAEDLVVEGWLGRNLGWHKEERQAALSHMAAVLRLDNGSFAGGGEPYAPAFAALGRPLDGLEDEAVVRVAASFVADFMRTLRHRERSPYDEFLRKNGLPSAPAPGESPEAFHGRLLSLLQAGPLQFVTEGVFRTHDQPFRFGPLELAGLKTFLTPQTGNCASCHSLPHFTNFRFHNTGVSQLEYDREHGPGAFAKLLIPSLAKRTEAEVENLRSQPYAGAPERADLGLWGVFANPAYPKPQEKLRQLLCLTVRESECGVDEILGARAVARFKTPGLRNLGHSAPYLHDGSATTLDHAMAFYVAGSILSRDGRMVNPDPEMARMRISGRDREPLAAFLQSLNEDF